MNRRLVVMLVMLGWAWPAVAQQRPLETEDPETIGAGRILIESGVDYKRDVSFPLSGLRGNLFTFPPIGVSVGVSSIAEIQLDGALYQKLTITERNSHAPLAHLITVSGDTTSDVDDLNIGMKVRFLSETPGRPAMGFRFWTRLPNAENETGLGKDMQDF